MQNSGIGRISGKGVLSRADLGIFNSGVVYNIMTNAHAKNYRPHSLH